MTQGGFCGLRARRNLGSFQSNGKIGPETCPRILSLLTGNVPGYADNPLRHDLWRAGHAHAGVYLVLSLVMLRYVDDALLSPFWKWLARAGAPIAAILIPAAFFLSVASPTALEPNGLIVLAYIGALFLAGAVLTLGVGLILAARRQPR
jgi:uncharacterized membrane protein